MKTQRTILFLLASLFAALSSTCWAQNGATFSPPVLNFGQIPWGATNTQLVIVTLTGEHLDDATPPQLRFFGAGLLAANMRVTLFSQKRAGNTLQQTYQVTPPDIVGPIRGTLWLKVTSPDGRSGYPYNPNGVTITGETVSCLRVSPATIDFGRVSVGKGKAERLSLVAPSLMEPTSSVDIDFSDTDRGKAYPSTSLPILSNATPSRPPTALDQVPHTSQSPYISLAATDGFTSSETACVLWQLWLDPKTPPGLLQTTVTFTSSSGQIIVVPVSATIVDDGSVPGHK